MKSCTLVLLPGLNGTQGLFRPLLSHAPKWLNVETISYPEHTKKSYEALQVIVEARLRQIDGKFLLLGESFSGPLALMVSQKKYDRLIGIILVATFVRPPNIQLGKYLPWVVGFSMVKPLFFIRALFAGANRDALIGMMAEELNKVSPIVLADRIQSIFAVDVRQQLKNCSVPIMYFRGEKDWVVPMRNLTQILQIKPDTKVVRFKTMHAILQSMPKDAMGEIERFTLELLASSD